MAADFGLLVARFRTSTPVYSVDNDLRELRIDAGGRVHSRDTDGNDNTISYFKDGDAFASGVGGAVAGDRGVLVLGRDATDSIYKVLSVNSDGSLSVSFNAGTDASEAADKANVSDGQVALTSGTWVLIQSKALATGKFQVAGWSYSSDKNTLFQLALATSASAPARADITEILDSAITTSASPTGHLGYLRDLTRAGGTNVKLCVFAKQLQAGSAGVGLSMMNYATTT